MDIAIKKNKKLFSVRRIQIAAAVLIVLLGIVYLWHISQAGYSVDSESLVVSEVKRGNFSVSVRGTGSLVPDDIQFLSATVEATVTKVVVKAGIHVKTGDVIVELNNPQLVQQSSESKWDMEALEAELISQRLTQESSVQQQKSNVLNAKLDLEKAQNEFEARAGLVKTGVVPALEGKKTRVEMSQAEQRWELSKQILAKMQENLIAQNNARNTQLNKARKIYENFQDQVDKLHVRASMDSVVLEVPVEVGQRIPMGAKIAKLADQDSLIAELRVPEIQIRDVAVGQPVIIDTRNAKVQGKVSRIDPAVNNGNVQVDVEFTEGLPKDARPDLSVDGEIKITNIPDALYVDRPLFAQSKAKSSVYKLTKDGKFAERITVEIGYGAVNQIQVIAGLIAGDKIITSDQTRFESYEKVRIK